MKFNLDVNINLGKIQSNESSNNMISSYASKRLSWGDSYDARACIAIGMKNSPQTYEMSMMDAVGAPGMSPVIQKKFFEENRGKFNRNVKNITLGIVSSNIDGNP